MIYSSSTNTKDYQTSMPKDRSLELELLARHIAEKGVTLLPHRRNKAFTQYVYASKKAASLARDAGMRKTGGVARATFDLAVARQFAKAGEPDSSK